MSEELSGNRRPPDRSERVRNGEEFDSIGTVAEPANHCWDAQTQRTLQCFNTGHDRTRKDLYHAYGYATRAAAIVNTALESGGEVIGGKLDTSSPCAFGRPVRGVNRYLHSSRFPQEAG